MPSVFDGFPYSNTHELNLDWLLGIAKKAEEAVDKIEGAVASAEEAVAAAEEAAAAAAEAKQAASDAESAAESVGGYTVNGYPVSTNPDLVAGDVGAAPALVSQDYPGCYYRNASDNVVEWINPPMILNTEYATTERYNGKRVYACLKSVALSNAGSTGARLPSVPATVVSIDAVAFSPDYIAVEDFPIFTASGSIGAKIFVTKNDGGVGAKCFDDYSGYTAYVTVKYTKEAAV